MAQLKLGSRYNKAAKRVVSTVNADGRIDEKKADAVGFWGSDEKPAFVGECWVPYLAAGAQTTKDEALKQIGDLIDMLEQAQKADSLLVESNGSIDPATGKAGPTVKRYDGPVLGNMSVGAMADRSVLAGAETKDTTAAAYVCYLIKERLTLNHQQEMNGIMRKEAIERARTHKSGSLLKSKAAASGRSRSEDIA